MGEERKKVVIAVFGDEAVGKTALILQVNRHQHHVAGFDPKQFLFRRFVHEHVHTVEDTYQTQFAIESMSFDLHIIDTAEPPSEDLLRIHGAIAVFSSASRESFLRLAAFSPWFREFNRRGGFVSLVGTHTDVARLEVSSEDAQSLARKIGARGFQVYAKDFQQVRTLWEALLRQITWSMTPVEIPAKVPGGLDVVRGQRWYHLLAPIRICFGLRKPDGLVWFR
ncbi:GTP-binding protein [Exophiala xenobiotica]|nr:GTP-binding protein [Exophiala xenobiotica]KAK5283506.1 GTP-binding protein [Exophiala xenobiotica]KAK5371030.1 GTP-binding protein [Exophiala xenobiotica]KAK5401225.1 GTP-binding protein [Exophiala xenobiotica]KAK5409152.1 GTP-binding protein [Exophiala xenobiotica]